MVMKVEPSWMEIVSPLPTLWGYSKKLAVCSLEEGSHQNPTVTTPWSQTFSLWKCEKYISFIYKPPIYGILVQQPELRQKCTVSTFWKIYRQVLLWWSSGCNFALPMQGVWVRYLVVELRSHTPHSHKDKTNKCSYWGILGDDGDRQSSDQWKPWSRMS